jgi:DNA-binding transcriptional MocR family regulator
VAHPLTAFPAGCLAQMVCSLLLDSGDSLLCEEFTYPHIMESMIRLRGYR